MLRVAGLQAFYGASQVLHGVDFEVAPGEIVALLGRNGAGRTTTAKALMGMVETRGSARWNNRELVGLRPFEVARYGLGYVPESRDVFPSLSVEQNLRLGCKPRHAPGSLTAWVLEDVYRLFPILLQRRHTAAGVLSGGEQQMLSLCRTLMGNPECLIVDEPAEGLAPQRVAELADLLRQVAMQGVAVLLIEQKLSVALALAHRVLLMGRGRIVFSGSASALRADEAVRREWLEV
ncbi:MAG: ABC transporter ATP-binding protein [Pseudomonadota bacterium]